MAAVGDETGGQGGGREDKGRLFLGSGEKPWHRTGKWRPWEGGGLRACFEGRDSGERKE